METSYQIWYVRRKKGIITEVAVSFYEGDNIEEAETGGEMVTRYRPRQRLSDLAHVVGLNTKTDSSGVEHTFYMPVNFGRISSDAELATFLEAQLAKDLTRTPAAHQGGP